MNLWNTNYWEGQSLSYKDKKLKSQMSTKLSTIYKNLEDTARNCYNGKAVVKIEVKNGVVKNEYSDELLSNLTNLNLQKQVQEMISSCKSPIIQKGFNDNISRLISYGEEKVINVSKAVNKEFEENEAMEVAKKLHEPQVYNLTNNGISQNSQSFLENGQKFTPAFKLNISDGTMMFHENICKVVSSSYKSLTGKDVSIDKNNFVESTMNISQDPILEEEECQFYRNLITGKNSILKEFQRNVTYKNRLEMSKFILTEREIKNLFNDENSTIVQSDKNLGFVNITNDELLNQFEKLNKKQHFVKATIIEEEYLNEIKKKKLYISSIMPEETKAKLSKKCLENLVKPKKNAEIGTMRLMPKIGKLITPTKESVNELTSRGIKSSINDPINDISEILSTLSKEVFTSLANAFERNFGRKCPVVLGSAQTSNLLKNEKCSNQDWMNSIEMSGDSTDMYSNANKQIVLEAYEFVFQFMDITPQEKSFFRLLIELEMTYNYFHEPTGIYTMTGGFAMGSHSSAIATDILLLTKEFKMFLKLKKLSLLSVIQRYLRFRDDVNAKLTGTDQQIVETLEILVTGYPKEIDYNVEVFFLKNEFLDFRFFSKPKSDSLVISVNRKKQTKFDIVRGFSVTNPTYLTSAVYSAAYSIVRNTNTKSGEKHEQRIFNSILKKRGYSSNQLSKAIVKAKDRIAGKSTVNKFFTGDKKYSGKIAFDSHTKLHMFILKLVKQSKLPSTLRNPIVVGHKKTINYVFTKRKFLNTLKKCEKSKGKC